MDFYDFELYTTKEYNEIITDSLEMYYGLGESNMNTVAVISNLFTESTIEEIITELDCHLHYLDDARCILSYREDFELCHKIKCLQSVLMNYYHKRIVECEQEVTELQYNDFKQLQKKYYI